MKLSVQFGMDIGFGIVPNGPESALAGDGLCARLAAELGWTIRYETYADPLALSLGFRHGQVDLLWSSPTLALSAKALREAVPVAASLREGVTHYHAVIFVLKDSPITGVLELRNRRVAWVADSSASGHIFPKLALAGYGVDPGGFFGQELFVGSHGAVVRAVAGGQVDAGATYAVFAGGVATGEMLRAGFDDAAPDSAFRVLLATPPIHADLLLLRRELHGEADAILNAFNAVGATHPREVTAVLGTHEFARVRPSALTELKVQVAHARALGIFETPLG